MDKKEIMLCDCRKIVLENIENEYHAFFANMTQQNSDTEKVFKNSNKIEFYTRMKEFLSGVILPMEYYPMLIKNNLLKTLYNHTLKERYLSTDKDCVKLIKDYLTETIKVGIIYS